jgi:cellulose synthase/poly-beta-1,6-N-acetylglucosamine synthase-like glycosyltransferase
MINEALVSAFEWIFIIYSFGLAAFHLILITNSAYTVFINRLQHEDENEPQSFSPETEGITIISPAYNEEKSIIGAIESLLALNYAPYEVIVVNDGSRDETLKLLIEGFDLFPTHEHVIDQVKATPVRETYRSKKDARLRVINKPNGGKADALNVGINHAAYDIICGVDADSMLDKESLNRIVQPLLKDGRTIAVGGMVRVMNGCELDHGQIRKMRLPSNFLALFQVVEYKKAFLYGRLGWLPFKALLLISGAFGIFRKDALVEVGGYRPETIGEDMELIVRMHRMMSARQQPYRIEFVADAICWTECPEDITSLRNQRVRWQRGLGESLLNNASLLFSRHGGAAGWIAFPFLLVFELFGPAIEMLGIMTLLMAFSLGSMSVGVVFSFLFLVLGVSMAVSAIALLIDEFHEGEQHDLGEMMVLFVMTLFETLVYRQIINYWRTLGLFQWMSGSKATWGTIKRRGHTTVTGAL